MMEDEDRWVVSYDIGKGTPAEGHPRSTDIVVDLVSENWRYPEREKAMTDGPFKRWNVSKKPTQQFRERFVLETFVNLVLISGMCPIVVHKEFRKIPAYQKLMNAKAHLGYFADPDEVD